MAQTARHTGGIPSEISDLAIARGCLSLHENGTYVKFTPAGRTCSHEDLHALRRLRMAMRGASRTAKVVWNTAHFCRGLNWPAFLGLDDEDRAEIVDIGQSGAGDDLVTEGLEEGVTVIVG